jgi:hypothetical protein
MKTHETSFQVNDYGLDVAIEPLASFICAADRPADAWKSVMSAIERQVEQTNRAAKAGVANFLARPQQVAV